MERPPVKKTFSMFGKKFTGVVVKKPLAGSPINLLMLRDKLPMSMTIMPEERLCITFADRMRELALTGKLRAIWSHIPNEGKRHRLVAMVMKAMGLIPGAPDYFFAWPFGGGVIEFKVSPNKLSDSQQRYRDWCQSKGVNWACVTSDGDTHEARQQAVGEAEDLLRKWGALA